ncbi:MAG: preprotein translocase subunit SecY [Armatimonadetes bacterium]|nr:preprotein translocase subunit SecY [Armatimonadota bacterium]
MFGAAAGGPMGDRGLKMPLTETIRLAWADPDLRQRITFVMVMFAVYVLGINIAVPIPGHTPDQIIDALEHSNNPLFMILNSFGGGALKKVSIFALGLNPYITASIIIQILTASIPQWKKDLQEGGDYARKQQNKKTRFLTLVLCIFQGYGLLNMMLQTAGMALGPFEMATVLTFWTAGAMFILWLGEQITEKGIGNGVSLMIFAGIMISLPSQTGLILDQLRTEQIQWWNLLLLGLVFVAVTWLIVLFTTAQRRIPIQHMRRQIGTRMIGGQTSYLPLSLNLAGVIPIIFAVSLITIPYQIAQWMGAMGPNPSPMAKFFLAVAEYTSPQLSFPEGVVGCLFYTVLIFFFTYFYTAIQYNVEDIANHLKRAGSFIPGVRPGKQTRDFIDGVISRITIVGAGFLAVVALLQYLAPPLTGVQNVGYFFGTSLLIVVSVALETMRQIEANLLMKQYGQ